MRLAFLEVDIQYSVHISDRDYSVFGQYAKRAHDTYYAMANPPEDPEFEYLKRTAEEVVGKQWLDEIQYDMEGVEP